MRRAVGLIIAALLVWGVSGVFLVQPDEVVLIRRCGRLLTSPQLPGAHLGLPWGIELRERVKPREVKRVSLGLIALASEVSGAASTQFLSADRNLVNVQATVQYTIADPADYVRQRQVADTLVAQAGQAELAHVLANQPIDFLLTHGKTEVAERVRSDLQQTLERYGLGVSVRSVDLGSLEPPAEVAAAFADVVAAQREREQTINQAHSIASQVIAEARARAQRTTDEARADGDRRVREATGEAQRFAYLLAEYQRNPALTARRIYWETMSDVLGRLRAKLLIDRGQQLDLSVFGTQPGLDKGEEPKP